MSVSKSSVAAPRGKVFRFRCGLGSRRELSRVHLKSLPRMGDQHLGSHPDTYLVGSWRVDGGGAAGRMAAYQELI